MQSIETKYHGQSSRISATTSNGIRAYVNYDPSLGTFKNHCKAVLRLTDKLEWKGEMITGDTKTGFVFVFIDTPYEHLIVGDKNDLSKN